MKKVLITIFLFISSFFLFGLKDVYASDYTRTITEEDLSLINDDFLDFRSQIIEFCGDTKNYIIYYESSTYKAIIYDKDSSAYISFTPTAPLNPWLRVRYVDLYQYKDNNLTFVSTATSIKSITIYSVESSSGYPYLDTNAPFAINSHTYTTIYNDKSYSFASIESTLYYIYLDNFGSDNSYEEEKSFLLSFYTCIIEKISYLATSFATNYIFLTTFCIFVLIFIVYLVRRLLKWKRY